MIQNASMFRIDETFEQTRQRMLEETSRFIEWGLKNPDKIPGGGWVPVYRVGTPPVPEHLAKMFWSYIFGTD